MSAGAGSAADGRGAFCLGLLHRRWRVGLTWRGWLAVLLALALGAVLALRGAHDFLAVDDPVRGGVLAMEGWVRDKDLRLGEAEYRSGAYTIWCVTGGPLEKGAPLSEYVDYANLSLATFTKMGGDAHLLHPVPCALVLRDRTYASALALKVWLREQGYATERVNVMTSGAHARRSRLLYEKAFGPETRVGVISLPDEGYDPEHWWRSSAGFRDVVGELVAYVYARCFFRAR